MSSEQNTNRSLFITGMQVECIAPLLSVVLVLLLVRQSVTPTGVRVREYESVHANPYSLRCMAASWV